MGLVLGQASCGVHLLTSFSFSHKGGVSLQAGLPRLEGGRMRVVSIFPTLLSTSSLVSVYRAGAIIPHLESLALVKVISHADNCLN